MQPSAVKGRFRVLAQQGRRFGAVALLLLAVLSLAVALPLTASAQNRGRGNDRRVAPADFGSFGTEAVITVRDNSSADTYPLTVGVSGLNGLVTDVDVTLNRMDHTFPDDLDVMLESPDGRAVIILSDAGGGGNIQQTSVTFDDEGADTAPNAGPIISRTYKPTNCVGGVKPDAGAGTCTANPDADDAFGNPAPQPNGTDLSRFDGINPNGNWRLYVRDDQLDDTGQIFGFRLDIQTTNAGPVAVDDFYQAKAGKKLKKSARAGVLANDRDADFPRESFTARVIDGPKIGRLNFNSDGSFTFRAKKKVDEGKTTFLYQVRDQGNLTDTGKVTIEIKERKNKGKNDKDDRNRGKNNGKNDKDKKKNRD